MTATLKKNLNDDWIIGEMPNKKRNAGKLLFTDMAETALITGSLTPLAIQSSNAYMTTVSIVGGMTLAPLLFLAIYPFLLANFGYTLHDYLEADNKNVARRINLLKVTTKTLAAGTAIGISAVAQKFIITSLASVAPLIFVPLLATLALHDITLMATNWHKYRNTTDVAQKEIYRAKRKHYAIRASAITVTTLAVAAIMMVGGPVLPIVAAAVLATVSVGVMAYSYYSFKKQVKSNHEENKKTINQLTKLHTKKDDEQLTIEPSYQEKVDDIIAIINSEKKEGLYKAIGEALHAEKNTSYVDTLQINKLLSYALKAGETELKMVFLAVVEWERQTLASDISNAEKSNAGIFDKRFNKTRREKDNGLQALQTLISDHENSNGQYLTEAAFKKLKSDHPSLMYSPTKRIGKSEQLFEAAKLFFTDPAKEEVKQNSSRFFNSTTSCFTPAETKQLAAAAKA